MNNYKRITNHLVDPERLKSILSPGFPHIHALDLHYRLASTWRDLGCELGTWERGSDLLAWAVFQPPWYNLDFACQPEEDAPGLLEEVLHWGATQMKSYAQRVQDDFYGSIEFFADDPLGVHPAYQGRGLGRALELSVLQRLRELGVRYGLVDHASSNTAAIALSQQTGFRQTHHALRYYLDVIPT